MTLYKSDGSLIFRLQFRNPLLWARSTQVCLTKYLPTPSPRTAWWLPPHPGLGGVSWSRDQEREVTAAAWRGKHIKSPTLLCLEQSHPALGVGDNPLQEGTFFDGQYIRQLNPDKVSFHYFYYDNMSSSLLQRSLIHVRCFDNIDILCIILLCILSVLMRTTFL